MIASWKLGVEGSPSELLLLQGDRDVLEECLPWPSGLVLTRAGTTAKLTFAQARSLLQVIEELDMLAVGNMPMKQRVEAVPELGFVSPRKLIALVKDLLASAVGYEAA